MRRVVVRPAAAADIEEAFLWYDSQLPGLGVDFREELRAAFARIVAAPELHQVIHRNTRRALLKRFPYGVFFCVFRTSWSWLPSCMRAATRSAGKAEADSL